MSQYRKKLIEVALPLEAINVASAREKSIRHGHPSTLHLWWARRPLAACRAVLFASLIDDPEQENVPQALLDYIDRLPTAPGAPLSIDKLKLDYPDLTEAALEIKRVAQVRRIKLFNFIEKLVQWDNSNNETILKTARELILAATDGNPPPALDPFCGGGSIPLEAQRLGLEAHGSDLNPVAVLITKALIELPPKFANMPPINPEARQKLGHTTKWKGAAGLAEDVRYYGNWMRDEAFKRIGHLYPKVQLPKEYAAEEATVIAWLWARTVKCPNPACGAMMPLVRSFAISTKKGKGAWVEPIIDRETKNVHFKVNIGQGNPPEGTVNRRGATCIVCNSAVSFDQVRTEGKAGRMSQKLMAVVAESKSGRVYLSPSQEQVTIAEQAKPTWKPDTILPFNPRDLKTPNYGMQTFADLFTPRQLVALTTFSDLIGEVREKALIEGVSPEYTAALVTYLAFGVDKAADYWSSICSWHSGRDTIRNTFARQAIPMVWDFAEANPMSDSTGNFSGTIEWVTQVIGNSTFVNNGEAKQLDATNAIRGIRRPIISTDPPYYDNIGYADLSDFFYVWLRRSLGKIYPDLFSTLLVPKTQELVATPYRFGGSKEKAQHFFEEGLGQAFSRMRDAANPAYPLTVYYAFKQTESDEDEDDKSGAAIISSTGWETMLEGLIQAGFAITGTWPMRTELANRSVGLGANALASSIVLVCRQRPETAPLATRREFLNALKQELPTALRNLQQGNIAPVDLAQASIGPGMAVFSRYSKVVESDGRPMRVRTALQLINQSLDEVLAEQEGEYDADTRWAIAWFDQFGQNEGAYGTAETLSKAKNTSIEGLVEAGFLLAKAGKVRLLRRDELQADWNPQTDHRLTVWEVTQHLIHALDKDGEKAAATLLAKVGALGEIARDLAYRLYTTCERKAWAQEALAYNTLVVAWPEISRLAQEAKSNIVVQATLGL